MAIVINSSNDSNFNLEKITFDGKNMRRLVLCLKRKESGSSDPVEMVFTGTVPRTLWRTILVAENVHLLPLILKYLRGTNLIKSNRRSFKWSSSSQTLNLSREESSNF